MPQKVSVVLYTRAGCHLCDRAKSQMLAAGCSDLYELEEVNIDTKQELLERYGTLIPVIAINGVDTFKYRVNPAEFRKSVIQATTVSQNQWQRD